MIETGELLRAYAKEGAESAFRELVNRYTDLVYSTALRWVDGDSQQAGDVAQTVFINLARKAPSLPSNILLGGWLHRHTGFVARNVMRSEQRRRIRERTAVEMNAMNNSEDWSQLAPVLDETLEELEEADRSAILLRFFEKRDLRAIGTYLGTSEDAAQKRVSRALDKLRGLLMQRGVSLSAAGLGVLLAERAVQAAPSGLSINLSQAARAAIPAGMGGMVAQILTGAKLKFALVAASLALVGITWVNIKSANQAPSAEVQASQGGSDAPDKTMHNTQATAREAVKAVSLNSDTTSKYLMLTILAADTGKPIPNVPLDYLVRAGTNQSVMELQATRLELHSTQFGECQVPWTSNTTELEVTTRLEGFADTRLQWDTARGDKIPEHYLLKLEHSARIGGLVVDADGNPVTEARVGFNHKEAPALKSGPESHDFGWLETATDDKGRWRLDRIAPDMLPRLYGSARHPDHAESAMAHVEEDAECTRLLQEEKHVFHLRRAVTIQGEVIGTNGRGIAGATVLVGFLGASNNRKAITEYDGRFELSGCPMIETLLTAQARDYQPASLPVNLTVQKGPFKVVLTTGKLLRLRVVNQAGAPIAKAALFLNTHQQPFLKTAPVMVQADLNGETNPEGSYVVVHAPDQELVFDCHASGYMRLDGIKVRPDGQEHVIIMASALTVQGTVRDAATDQPLPSFRILCGCPGRAETPVQWSTLDQFSLRFANGEFRHTFEEAVVSGVPNPGYVLKFDAEGFQPVVSRIIRPDEAEVRLDIKLRQTEAIRSPTGQ